MGKLHLEELEPRELLNGTSFGPQPAPSQPPAAGPDTMNRPAERAPAVDHDDNPGGPTGANHPTAIGPVEVVVVAPAAPAVAVVSRSRPGGTGSPSLRAGIDLATVPHPAGAEAGENPPQAPVAGGPLPASLKPSDVVFTSLETPILLAGWRADSSPASLADVVPDRGLTTVAPQAIGQPQTPPVNPQAGGPAEPSPLPPQLSGMLTVLRRLDVIALELGMQRFLEELEAMGSGMAIHPGGNGLRLWIAAGAAAALACELARRQLRRAAVELALETDRGPDAVPGPLPRSLS